MSSPIIITGQPARHRAAPAHHARGNDPAQIFGWLLFGGVAIAIIYWLTKPRNAAGAVVAPPEPMGTVTTSQVVTSPGPFQGQPVGVALETNGCWDPQLYQSKLLPGEVIRQGPYAWGIYALVAIGAGSNGTDLLFPGCPNEALRLR